MQNNTDEVVHWGYLKEISRVGFSFFTNMYKNDLTSCDHESDDT